MAQNNTDILNEILLDLEILIEEQSKHKDNKNIDAKEINLKIEGHEDVVALLTGLGAFNNDKKQSIKDVANDIETLAKGLKGIQDIDAKKIELNGKAVRALISDIIDIVNDKKVSKMLTNISNVIAGSAAIGASANNIADLAVSLEMLTQILIDKDLSKKLLPVLDFLGKAGKIGSNKNARAGIKAVLCAFGPIIALKLRFFFSLMSKIGDSKQLESTMLALKHFINAMILMGANDKHVNKGLKVIKKIANFDREYVYNFTEFLSALLQGLPDKKDLKEANNQLKFLLTYMSVIADMPLLSLLILAKIGKTIDPEAGTNIGKFLVNIIEPLTNIDKEKMQAATDMVNALGNILLKIVGAIAIMTLLVALDLGATLIATVTVIVIIGSLIGLSKLLSTKENEEGIDKGVVSMNKLCSSLLYVTAAIGIMALLIKLFDIKEILIATGIVLGVIFALIMLTKLLGNKENKEGIDNSVSSLASLCKSLMWVVGAIGIMALLVTLFDVGMVIVGTLIVIGIIAALIGLVKLLSMIEEKQLKSANHTMITLAAILTVISLICLFVFPGIYEKASEVILGALIVIGVVAVLALITFGLSKIGGDNIKEAITAMAVLTGIVLVLSLVALFILVPLGDAWKPASIGAAVVLGIIGLMTLIVYGLSKIDGKELRAGEETLAVLTIITLVISLIALYLLVPIGEQWDKAAAGGAVVLGVLAILTAMAVALTKLMKKITLKDLLKAGELLAEAIIALVLISEIVERYFIPIGEYGEEALIGGALVLGTLAIMEGIMYAAIQITKAVSLKDLALGGVFLGAIGGILWILSITLSPYFDLVQQVADMKLSDILFGLAVILATLAVFGAIMAGLGLLVTVTEGIFAVVMGAGMAILGGVAAVIGLIGEVLPPYFDLVDKVNKTENIDKASNKIIGLIAKFGALIAAIGMLTLVPFFGLGLGIGLETLVAIADSIKEVKRTILAYADTVTAFSKLSPGDRANFEKYMTDVNNGFVGTMNKIMSSLNDLGLRATKMAALIAINMRPIFVTILDFMKVIQAFGTLRVVTEWDQDGHPVAYEQMTPAMFKSAANAISSSFCLFVALLGMAMKSWDKESIETMKAISGALGPVMLSVGTFVLAICNFISMNIADEWDKEGKPTHFSPVNILDFHTAANTIADAFGSFLDLLSTKLLPLSEKAKTVMLALKDGIEPVMMAVSTFAKALMEVTAGTIIETSILDANGKPITDKNGQLQTIKELVKFEPKTFAKAAKTIGNAFITFLDTLYKAFEEYDYDGIIKTHVFSEDTVVEGGNKMANFINAISNIGSIVTAVMDLTKFIIENAEKIGTIDMGECAKKLSGGLISFLRELKDDLGKPALLQGDAGGVNVELIANNMKHVQNIINTYKKIYDLLQKMMDAVSVFQTATNSMTSFMQSFINKSTLDLYNNVATAIDGTINPALAKAVLIYKFFSSLEYNHTKIDIKKSLKNVKDLLNIMNDFTQALIAYNNAPKEFSIDVINQIGAAIGTMYNNADTSYIKYYTSFSKISKKYTSDVTKTVVPTITSLVNSASALYAVFTNLDKQLINDQKKREEALKKLTEQIKEVNSATKDLADNLAKVEKSSKDAYNAHRQLSDTKLQANNQEVANTVGEKLASTILNKSANNSGNNKTEGKANDPMEQLGDIIASAVSSAMAGALNQFLEIMKQERPVVFKDLNGKLVGTGKTTLR